MVVESDNRDGRVNYRRAKDLAGVHLCGVGKPHGNRVSANNSVGTIEREDIKLFLKALLGDVSKMAFAEANCLVSARKRGG